MLFKSRHAALTRSIFTTLLQLFCGFTPQNQHPLSYYYLDSGIFVLLYLQGQCFQRLLSQHRGGVQAVKYCLWSSTMSLRTYSARVKLKYCKVPITINHSIGDRPRSNSFTYLRLHRKKWCHGFICSFPRVTYSVLSPLFDSLCILLDSARFRTD